MYTVRQACESDVPSILMLAEDMVREIGVPGLEVNVSTAPYFIRTLIKQAGNCPSNYQVWVIVDEEDRVYGMLGAERLPCMWFTKPVVVEHALYVKPELRGTISVGRMLSLFAKWADQMPSIVRVQAVMNGMEADAAFSHLGYKPRGRIYGKEG